MFKFIKKEGNGMDRSNSIYINGPSKALGFSPFDVKKWIEKKQTNSFWHMYN